MSDKKANQGEAVLCPYLERPCPQGEDMARFCQHLIHCDVDVVDDYSGFLVDCYLAARMTESGRYGRN